ncbi:hypothetical protein AAMO2058_000825000 [Amorphochlora amoebiformis]|uniref:COMM domain-containing protein 5 n=1 Tax=Amorphochlora amoebiformis TaxID=1561963 RepID=A0A7S0GSE3_9EUKA|mmetsp:Transcript_15745/g.24911  ORF Transcript_15745/g.24911 Transcript_15745/m.24911 type:complete len:224 (+) Transcript_15745:31-702(+)
MALQAKRRGRFGSRTQAQSQNEMWQSVFIERSLVKQVRSMCRTLVEDKVNIPMFKTAIVASVEALTERGLSTRTGESLMDSKLAQGAFVGLCVIFRSAVRQKLEEKVFNRDVGNMMPKEYASILCKAYRSRRAMLSASVSEAASALSLPKIQDVRWRVDVTISTTCLSRVFRPSVLLSLTLTDGKIRTFEVSVEKFNELRYNIAKLLKVTLDLDSHPMLMRDL